jgi:colicin import membrane protein
MEAEKFFENQEKEKARSLNLERIEKIRPYVEDADKMNFSEFDDQSFDDFVLGKKTRFENELKEREAEVLRIEKERLAEIERKKAIEEENAKLKAEAEQKEKELQKERAESLSKQKAIQDESDKKAREEKAKQDAILKSEQEAKTKLEAELKAKKDAEIKAENERLALLEQQKKDAEKLAKAPIKKQLNVWVESFNYGLQPVHNEVTKEIIAKFEAFKKWSLTQVNNL